MTINKVRTDIPFAEAIRKLQDNDNQLLGLAGVDQVDAIDLQDLFSGTGHASRFTRDFPLGHSLATYNLFSGVSNEAGYTIWKYPVTSFADSVYNALYLDDVKLNYRGAATSEAATAFNSVFLLSGTTWVNNTVEAGTDNGTAFGLMSHSSNSLYVGDTNTFNGVDFNFDTLGYGYDLRAYYFSGTWVELSTITHSLKDDTSDFTSNGRLSFTIPTDWISGTFNGVNNKWIKLTTDSNPVTTAQSYYIRPDDSVKNLLSLSSDDILDKNWAWCYFNNYVYLTLKNRGGLGYEGNEWIRIESNETNRKNYFVYNHELKTTYHTNTWTQWEDDLNKVRVSSNDTTTGYLNGKLVAGPNITLTELNNGSAETLQLSAFSGTTGIVKAVMTDLNPSSLQNKISGTTNQIIITAGTQSLSLSSSLGNVILSTPTQSQSLVYSGTGGFWYNTKSFSGYYQDRGDPNSNDFTLASFTTDASWRTLSLASIVPIGAKLIHMGVYVKNNTGGSEIDFRNNAIADVYNVSKCFEPANNADMFYDIWVSCDSNRIIQYKADNVTWAVLNVIIRGWQY